MLKLNLIYSRPKIRIFFSIISYFLSKNYLWLLLDRLLLDDELLPLRLPDCELLLRELDELLLRVLDELLLLLDPPLEALLLWLFDELLLWLE